jgi:ABC-2 type transport system ATP-binding protein
MEEVFQHELAALRDEGRTALLSSHILSEVEKACDRVSIVRAGRIVDSGSLTELRHLTRTRVHAVLQQPLTSDEVARWPGLHDVAVDGTELRCSVDTDQLGRLVATLGNRGVAGLTCQPPTLEELFLARYQAPADAGGSAGTPRSPQEQPA